MGNIITVTSNDIMDNIEEYEEILHAGDMLIAGFSALDGFDYMSEYLGESQNLKKLVELSSRKKIVLIAGAEAHLIGKLYNIAIIIDRGNIMGVSDQTHKTLSELALGDTLKLYETSIGKTGVLIGEDIFFPECALALSITGAERLVYLTPSEYQKEADAMLRAASIFCGLPIVSVFCNCTIEYHKGIRNVLEEDELLVFENSTVKNGAYIKNRRTDVYRNVTVHKFL